MSKSSWPFWEFFSEDELKFSSAAAENLEAVSWARPLLDHLRKRRSHPTQVRDNGLLGREYLADLFELRFAGALVRNAATAAYECSAGVGNSTIDFRVDGSPPWLIELVSLRVTEAVDNATIKYSPNPGETFYFHHQDSSGDDKKNSLAYEMITAEGKIAEKVFRQDAPTKFPEPTEAIHAILIDMKGFDGGTGGDWYDWLQIAVGAQSVGDMDVFRVHTPNGEPVRGVFEEQCPLKGAGTLRERIHFLGFVLEKDFVPGEIEKEIHLINNPHLLPTVEDFDRAMRGWPFIGTKIRPIVMPSSSALTPNPSQ